MHYKITYQDPRGRRHCRYYSALNHATAEEMFKATVSHSIKEPVQVLNVYKMSNNRWKPVEKK